MINYLGLKVIVLLFIFWFGISPIHAQLYKANQIVERFLKNDIEQSQAFDDVCANLNSNFDEIDYNEQIVQLKKHPQYNKSSRFQIRLYLYERYGYIRNKKFDPFFTEEHLFRILKLAIPLQDDQLLSDVYAKYAMVCVPEKRNYYLLKSIEIRERIGVKYFWVLRFDYHALSEQLYKAFDYEGSLRYASRSLKMYNKDILNSYVFEFILGADLAGASYLKINKPDSSIYYYKRISQILNDIKQNPSKFDLGLDPIRIAIWNGVAKGGIGKAYLMQGNYDLARKLLMDNLKSSTKYKQWDDVADLEVNLAKLAVNRNHVKEAISRYNHGYDLALKSKNIAVLVDASEGLASLYSGKNQLDSALFYQKKYTQWNQIKTDLINKNQLDLVKGQLEFKKLQIDLLQSQRSLKQQKKIRNLVLLTVGCFLAVILFVYNRKRLKFRLKEESILSEKQRLLLEKKNAQQIGDFFKQQAENNDVIIERLQTKLDAADHSYLYNELRNFKILTDQDWQGFKNNFELLYPGYNQRLKRKFPQITVGEQRIVMLAKLDLKTKEMANISGVSMVTIRSVISRLRKKLNIEGDFDNFVNGI